MKDKTVYQVTPYKNILQFLSLPKFQIIISENEYGTYKCYIKDFGLYVHSADKDYTSALEKIQKRVQDMVIMYFLDSLIMGKDAAIYGKDASDIQKQVTNKLRESYNALIENPKKFEEFVKNISISPFKFSEEKGDFAQISKLIKEIYEKYEKLKTIGKDDALTNHVLKQILSYFQVFEFLPTTA